MKTLAPTINSELQRIFDRDGHLLPEAVVKAAKDPKSPLHGSFTWSTSEAAGKWRRAEAAELIRRAKIVITTDPEKIVKVRAFVSVLDNEKRFYMPTELALTNHRDQVFEQAQRDVDALRKRYESLVDFDEVLRLALAKSEAA